MKKIIILKKKEGETPLECMGRFRGRHKAYREAKLTYAGRLDPMATGVLLVLAGDEIKSKEKYLALDKEYEFEILFGFATDTYDILGKVVSMAERDVEHEELAQLIKQNLKKFTGKFIQIYPAYSSKTVKGKALFAYAREGVSVEAPSRAVLVKKLQFHKLRKVSNKKLLENIEKRIKKVNGDFRQRDIIKIWKQKLSKKSNSEFYIGSFHVKCSSGTYVRGIANSLGKEINVPALAFSIMRTKIGKWSKENKGV